MPTRSPSHVVFARGLLARLGRPPRSRFSLLIILTVLAYGLTDRLHGLVITEIQYHSENQLGDGTEDHRWEWIEFFNETADPLDLSEFYISRGVFYRFEMGTILPGRSFLVIAAEKHDAGPAYPTAGGLLE